MIEWKTGNDDWDDIPNEWETSVVEELEPTKTETSSQRTHRRRHIVVLLSLLVVLVAVTGGALKWSAERNVAEVEAQVQNVVDQEMWALETGNWDLYESLLDQQTPVRWYREQQGNFVHYSQKGAFSAQIVDLALVQPDLALAEVTIDPPGRQVLRETRAYRQIGATWRHTTAPAGHLWLHQMERETANLRFIYHRDDADRLEPLFPALQRLYTQILTDFNLAPLPNRREVQVVLSIQPTNTALTDPSRRYDLSSLAATADTVSIQRELGTQLASKVMHQFYENAGDMAFVLDGIREWEIATWMGKTDPKSETRISRVPDEKPFVPLLMVKPAYFDKPALTALTKTITEYLVWRNGRGALQPLIQHISEYDGWVKLVDEGLGISYQHMARGWWQFITQQYAFPKDQLPDEVYADLTWMLQLEQQAHTTRDQELFCSLLDPQAPSEWKSQQLDLFLRGNATESIPEVDSTPTPARIREREYEVQNWGYQDDVAWIVLKRWLNPSTDTNRFSRSSGRFPQLRVYRFGDNRWYLTSPATAFTDPPLIARTQHFAFRYREPDADVVQSVLPHVDELYEQLVRDLGLDTGSMEHLAVELVYLSNTVPYHRRGSQKIQIPSPQLARNFSVDPANEFELTLGITVGRTLLTDALGEGYIRFEPLLDGLVMWEVTEWSDAPQWEARRTEIIRHGLAYGVLRLPTLPRPSSVLDTAIAEYVAQAYGRHRFADIVAATREQRDLQHLITAALNVDLETFEAGWRSYLEQTYNTRKTTDD